MYFQSFQNFLKRTAKRAPIPLRTVAEIAASTLVKVSPIIRKLKPGFGPTKTIEFSYCYVENVNLTATFKCKLHFVLELLS